MPALPAAPWVLLVIIRSPLVRLHIRKAGRYRASLAVGQVLLLAMTPIPSLISRPQVMISARPSLATAGTVSAVPLWLHPIQRGLLLYCGPAILG